MSTASTFRFAPTPNGALHLGHAYSALMNARLAGAASGRLLLRIEDLDRTRCKPEYEAAIRDDLAWLGLAFVGAARRQSEHGEDYERALDALRVRGLAYPCFCSRGMVAAAASGRDPDGAPLYPRTCRSLAPRDVAARLAVGEPAAWRLDSARARAVAPVELTWREFGEGEMETRCVADPAAWGDFVLRGRDAAASYHLAVVVDDALQEISDVVRGRDLFSATSAHRLLQALLGLPAPRYRHHRLVLDANGDKMSKSAASTPLRALRAQGATADDLRVALGFAPGAPRFAVRLS
ncbi:MAG: tRNA glutamyl-Q(34) synthetase GluQRS [Roseiarcus sp.]|jgi:glutamyl-Q tRNA(Asp) synthetase